MEEIIKLNNLNEAFKNKMDSIQDEFEFKLNKVENSIVNLINSIYKWGCSAHWYIKPDTKDALGKEIKQKFQIIEEVGDEVTLSKWHEVCGEIRVSRIKILQFNENEIGVILYALDEQMNSMQVYYQLMHDC